MEREKRIFFYLTKTLPKQERLYRAGSSWVWPPLSSLTCEKRSSPLPPERAGSSLAARETGAELEVQPAGPPTHPPSLSGGQQGVFELKGLLGGQRGPSGNRRKEEQAFHTRAHTHSSPPPFPWQERRWDSLQISSRLLLGSPLISSLPFSHVHRGRSKTGVLLRRRGTAASQLALQTLQIMLPGSDSR